MLFYVLIDRKGELSFSPIPKVDRHYEECKLCLLPGLPLQKLKLFLSSYQKQGQGIECWKQEAIRCIENGIARELGILNEKLIWQELTALNFPEEKTSQPIIPEHLWDHVISMIQGRKITERELSAICKIAGITETQLLVLLHDATINGYGEWISALTKVNNSWRCERCGNSTHNEWPSIYGQAVTCEHCKIMGPLSSLQVIFRLKDQDRAIDQHNFAIHNTVKDLDNHNFTFQFTPAQRNAAQKLLNLMINSREKEILVWAACGAGKTEVCFPLIYEYLAKQKRILFAAPRQDVVHDIQPRIQKNFPEIRISILSGAMPSTYENSQVVVATTHQVLRFYRYFDLVILDEIDAYPYAGSEMLQYGLNQAMKVDGQIVYLTATPSVDLLEKAMRQTCPVIRLPLRHHGHELPTPIYKKMRLPDKIESLQGLQNDKQVVSLMQDISALRDEGPVLLFVPTISMVNQWISVIEKYLPDMKVAGSWSSDPGRRGKVVRLLSGEYDVFITTSILERGITIQNVQVIVLFADHELFTTRALVQMAGRAGRTTDYPKGAVLFIGSKETKEIYTARKWIEEQNQFARKEGFIQ